jgi:hypothetical protein
MDRHELRTPGKSVQKSTFHINQIRSEMSLFMFNNIFST